MPENNVRLDWRKTYTKDEFSKLQKGLIPEEMEDKWFIYVIDQKLFLHRSWRGTCIYIVEFKQDNDVFCTTSVTVNRDIDQYTSTDNTHDLELLSYYISNLLLGKQETFPEERGGTGNPAGVLQHHMTGTIDPTIEVNKAKRPWWNFW